MVREFQLLSIHHNWLGTHLVFLGPIKYYCLGFAWIRYNPFSFPQLIILFSANWISSAFILISMPEAMIIMSSAVPGPDWNYLSEESITKFHTSGERIPPWGLPLPNMIVCVTPWRLVVTFLPFHQFVHHEVIPLGTPLVVCRCRRKSKFSRESMIGFYFTDFHM